MVLLPDKSVDQTLVMPLDFNETLRSYYQSLLSYLNSKPPPPKSLLRIKFEELIVNVLNNPKNQHVIDYLAKAQREDRVSIREIMEANFCGFLSISDFARLSARSLSTFRREFVEIYGMPPGKWLREKRLAFSCYLLANSRDTLEDIIYESGFFQSIPFQPDL